jgi:hypothetical protein
MGDKAFSKNKQGQVTLFIIIAIIIVALVVIIYAFFPKIKSGLNLETKSPQVFIQSCLEDELEEIVQNISLQGGSINPESSYLFDGYSLEYLCYTNEYYELCNVQQPFLKNHIEEEIENELIPKVNECFAALVEDYSNKGYGANLIKGQVKAELLPKRVVLSIPHNLTLTKDSTERFSSFNIVLNNNLYELVSIAKSIVELETTLGEADKLYYMMIYHDLRVEKFEQSEGSRVYVLTDRNNENKLQFAVRSVAFPAGY